MYNKYLRPKIEQVVYDSRLSDCIICDIDNTLLLKGDRGIYEFEKSYLDIINMPVKLILDNYKKGRIILFTGRENRYLDVTKNILLKYGVIFDYIFMRQDGDRRKDSVVKEELFDKHVLNMYNVNFVIDDRLQVLEMWWGKGVFVFNVNQGNIEF
jgi:hypothetical protein